MLNVLVIAITAVILVSPFLLFIPVEINIIQLPDEQCVITQLHFHKKIVKKLKPLSQIYYVPFVGNSMFFGRTIFKKESMINPEYGNVTYGYDGFKKIKQENIKDVFRAIIDY